VDARDFSQPSAASVARAPQVLTGTQPAPPPQRRKMATVPSAPVVVASATATAARRPVARAMPAPMAVPDADLRTRPLAIQAPKTTRIPRQVAAPPAAPPRPNTLTHKVRDYLGSLDLIQIVCWQIAAWSVLLTLRQPWPVLAAVAVGAALLIAVTTVRVGGRWLYQLGIVAVGYLTREKQQNLPDSDEKTPVLLATLLPDSSLRSTDTAQGAAMTISHHDGLTAILRPHSTRHTPQDLLGTLPEPVTLLPVSDVQGHVFGVQTVFHAGVRRDGPPKVWVSVLAARTADTPGDEELTLALRNGVRRVRRAMDRAGVPVEPMADDPAFAAVAGLAHVTGGRNEVREDWKFWRTGSVSQAVFDLRGFERLPQPQARRLVMNMFGATAGVAVSVTLGARAEAGVARVAAVLRLAATTEAAVTAAVTAINQHAAQLDVRLARLDGRHAAGVAASLPIGVFL